MKKSDIKEYPAYVYVASETAGFYMTWEQIFIRNQMNIFGPDIISRVPYGTVFMAISDDSDPGSCGVPSVICLGSDSTMGSVFLKDVKLLES